jgi:GNAT superfamily N-acetyltransferase
MEQPTISVTDSPDPVFRDAILQPLVAYSNGKVGPANLQTFAVFLREKDSEKIIGGLWGRSAYAWFVVELLFVPEPLRGKGLGSLLMEKAEHAAIERGCVGIWLDSFSFQAPKFYERLGYAVFGTLQNSPRGCQRIFFQKILPSHA